MTLRTNILTIAMVAGTLLPYGVAAEETEAAERRAAKRIPALITAGRATGMAVAMTAPGAEAVLSGYGATAGDGLTPMTPDTVFEIGSVSKVLTSLILAQLVLEGRVALEDPAQTHMPDDITLPQRDGRHISLRDLASHHSGLASVPDAILQARSDDPYASFSRADLAAYLADVTLARPPGQAFEYSNTGVALLGLALETATGQSYDVLARERIFKPLGMDSTFVAVPEGQSFAQGHDINGDPTAHWTLGLYLPAGGWRSTARDMARFIAAASGAAPSPLDEAFALILAQTRPTGMPSTRVALGWFETDGIIWHNGMTGGFSSFVGYRPETGMGLALLSNQAGAERVDGLGLHLLDASQPLAPLPEAMPEHPVPQSVLADYVGIYRLSPAFAMEISANGDRLYLQATDQTRLRFRATSDTAFASAEVGAVIRFVRDDSGNVVALELDQNGITQRAPRE